MTRLPAGTRIRLLDVPWIERRGVEGVVVVAPNGPGIYPDDPRDRERVLVLLDDDPFMPPSHEGWSCAVRRTDVEIITGEDQT